MGKGINSRDLRNFKVAVMSKDGKDELQQEEKSKLVQQLRLLELSQEPIHISRQIVEMREPLANGTLEAQRVVLKSAVDHIVVERNKAEPYYQFPCANLYKVPPARLERAHTASEAAALSA